MTDQASIEKHILAICLEPGSFALQRILAGVANPDGLFQTTSGKAIWKAICSCWKANENLNYGSIYDHADKAAVREAFSLGWAEVFGGIVNGFWMPESSLDYWLDRAIEKAQTAAVRDGVSSIVQRVKDSDVTFDDVQAKLHESSTSVSRRRNANSKKDALGRVIEKWEWATVNKGKLSGVTSGFRTLDNMHNGWQPRTSNIIGARPSQGKTALICNMIHAASVKSKIPTLFFSLESSQEEILSRLVGINQQLELSRLQKGDIDERGIRKASIGISTITHAPVYIEDDSSLTIQGMEALAQHHKREHGIKIVFIDYLQKIRADKEDRHSVMTYEIGKISQGIKSMAKNLDIPVVTAAQLRRGSDEKDMPHVSDLKDSGQIEQDADLIALLKKGDVLDPSEKTIGYDVLIAKHRDGPCGKVPLAWRAPTMTFYERSLHE